MLRNKATEETRLILKSLGISGMRRMLPVGRGATALCVLYRVLRPDGGRVILPAIGCPSILATALISGMKPVIVDVDRNLNIDPDEVKKAIKPGDIVLGIHLFGIPFQVERLKSICDESNAVLIEDAAQAIGGAIGGQPIGSFGDFSILSFAEGKILPTSGGGAILCSEGEIYEQMAKEIETLPERPNDLNARSKNLRDKVTEIFNRASRDNPQIASGWISEFEKAGDIYNYSITTGDVKTIAGRIRNLDEIRSSRLDGVQVYYKYLDISGIEHVNYPTDCCPFRFSFILPALTGTQVQQVTEKIRDAGIHASNLYLPLHWLAPNWVETPGCPRAEHAGLRVINLWLTDNIPTATARTVRDIITRSL
jgi:dTDP-4-amino-4,6-dideoxygalactose transaminase